MHQLSRQELEVVGFINMSQTHNDADSSLIYVFKSNSSLASLLFVRWEWVLCRCVELWGEEVGRPLWLDAPGGGARQPLARRSSPLFENYCSSASKLWVGAGEKVKPDLRFFFVSLQFLLFLFFLFVAVSFVLLQGLLFTNCGDTLRQDRTFRLQASVQGPGSVATAC